MKTRVEFHHQLDNLGEEILRLGSYVDEAINQSVLALQERNLDLARQVIANDERVNQLRFAIEEHCFTLLARQQPMARDLRFIIVAMNIATEMERMGDYAAGIGRLVPRLADQPLLKPLVDMPRMADLSRTMLRGSLDAFLQRDEGLARRISERDDELDVLYNQVFRELLDFMLADPQTTTRATYLLWIAHNLERLGDRVTNICERIIYMVTGQLMEFSSERDPNNLDLKG
jgi:phosphate transport system protein